MRRRAVGSMMAAMVAAALAGCRTAEEPCLAPGWTEPDASRPLSHADCVCLAARWAPNRAEWQARLTAAQAAFRQACAFPNPTLAVSWEDFGLYPGATREKLQTTFSLAYALEAIVSRKNRVIAARGDLDAQKAAILAEWQKLATGVHRAYDDLVALRARVGLEHDLEAVAARQRDAVSRFVASGIAPRIAMDRAEAELLSASADRVRAEARARAAELELAFALGFSRPVALVLSEPMTSEPAALPDDLGALLATAAEARPELLGAAAKIRAELARLQITIDRVQFLPTIGGGPRTQGGELRGVASIDVVLPVSDFGDPAEAAVRAAVLAAAAEARKEAQKVAGEVCLAAERLRSELAFLDTHARDLASRRTALRERTERMFAAGEATPEEVILARRDEVAARLALLDAELAAALARVDLMAALGRLSAHDGSGRCSPARLP